MLRLLYRMCASENNKDRPPWYSKISCLRSLIKAASRVDHYAMVVLCDGYMPWLRDELRAQDAIVTLTRSGNSESLLTAVGIGATYRDDDVLYFVEDDYLHKEEALEKLWEACEALPADYFTLYDHPDRYLPAGHCRHDIECESSLYLSRSHHWRAVESTCMTFGTRVCTLREIGAQRQE